jgi:hypothetical protein
VKRVKNKFDVAPGTILSMLHTAHSIYRTNPEYLEHQLEAEDNSAWEQ